MNTSLQTQDFVGVPIMAVGGPYHGKGSPPEGDYFDEAFLTRLADESNRLAAEVRAPVKIGHNPDQKLLKNSGLALDEQPAAGWVGNYRVQGGKLLADVRQVPSKLAALIRAGAFARRSVEIRRITSQTDGKPATVIAGLALLGAKAPAIRTLDDLLAHYREEHPDVDGYAPQLLEMDEPAADDVDLLVEYEDEQAAQDDHQATVNLAADQLAYQLFTTYSNTDATGSADWRYSPFTTIPKEGPPVPTSSTAKRDESSVMNIRDLTDEQVRSLADTLGVEVDDESELREAVTQKVSGLVAETPGDGGGGGGNPQPTPPQPDPQPDPQPTGVSLSDDELAAMRRDAALGKQAYEEARAERRERFLEDAVNAGKLAPSALETWRSYYDADADGCVKTVETLPSHPDLVRALGADGDSDETDDGFDKEYAAYSRMMGLSVPEGDN